MEDRTDVTVPMPGEMDEAIKSQLEYGDSRAEWIREAARQRLKREGIQLGDQEAETDGGHTGLAD